METTKQKIIKEAQNLFQKHGSTAVSYESISEKVGIKKASIHYHFPSKNDLIYESLNEYKIEFMNKVSKIFNSTISVHEKINNYISLFENVLIDSSYANACLCMALGSEINHLDDKSKSVVSSFHEENIEVLLEFFQKEMKKSQKEAKSMASLLFSSLEGAIIINRSLKEDDFFNSLRIFF